MVWGAISRRHTYPLIRIDGNLDAAQYISQVLNKITPKLPRPTSKRLVFMHDGAHAHTAAIVKSWMATTELPRLRPGPQTAPTPTPLSTFGLISKNAYKSATERPTTTSFGAS